jgi:hypothetical protein
VEKEMSNSFMSPLPTFTLESLVASGQWTAAQVNRGKKPAVKNNPDKKSQPTSAPTEKSDKSAL